MSLPILYKANETDFTHMGLGVLVDTVEAKVTEERNGVFELEMVYPTQSELFKELKVDRLIKVDANPTLLDQRFKIVKISSATGEMAKVHAEHVSYLTQELQLEPEVHYGGSAREALATWANNIVDTHPFTTDSDIQTIGEGVWRVEELDSARRALGGVRGSMLDTYGGEYRFDNYNIQLLKARGNSDTLLIAYGRNLTKLEQEEEIANTFTSVYPFARYTLERGEGSEVEFEDVLITLDERFIDSEHVDKYARRKILTLDLTDDGIKDQETLRARAVRYIEDNKIGVPRVNLRVAYQDLAQTLDYKDLQILERVDLTDHVLILFEDFGVERTAKIIKVVWDVLMERYDLLEIGEPRASLSDSISATVDGRVEKVESTINRIQASADGKNTNYSGIIEPTGDLKEGDLWLKPIGDKDTELYEFKNGVWRFILSTSVMSENKDKIDKAVEDLTEVKETAEETATDISNAIQGSGFINLADLVASKVSGDEASSLFFQEAKEIGLAYEENGEIKAMIGIVDGQIIQRGEKIFLDGDEIIANGTLTVTEDMFAEGITFDWAKGQTIDASQIRVINLDFDSMSGGAIELNEGFRITHNGQNVLSIDAETGRVLFQVPGIATKEDLEEIELTPGKSAYELAVEDGFVGTEQEWLDSLKGEDGKDGSQGPKGDPGAPGPEGIQGPEGKDGQSQWTHIRYSENADGSNMTPNPETTTKYIGIAVTNSATAPIYSVFTWSKYVGDDGNDGSQGPQGIPGNPGKDGQPTYTWIKYADTPTSGMDDFPDGKKYIGMAFNKPDENESTSYDDYHWSLMPQNIEIGGRNLLKNSGDEVSNGDYNIAMYELTDELKEDEEVTLTIWGSLAEAKTNFRVYNSGGSVALSVLKDNEDGTYSSTFKWAISGSDNTYLNVYAFINAQAGESTISKIKLERGNIATDWTEAPEDTQAMIDGKADTDLIDNIQGQLDEFITIDGYEAEIGEVNQALQDYKELIESGEVATEEAVSNIEDLLERTSVVENHLGEFTESWNFDVTEITMGEEGLFLGDNLTDMGIRISPQVGDIPPRIDFVDNGIVVAEITGQYMRINRGIFVKSAQIGEHQIETIAGGHTIWQWITPTP